VAGTTAILLPDTIASVSGSQNIAALSSAGGTLVINGQPITINPGDSASSILNDINGQTGTTGVTASLDPTNHLVLQSANAASAPRGGGGEGSELRVPRGC